MAVIPYPSIDSGFIYDPGKKLDALMSDFYESEQAQSYLFKSQITSFPYILQQYPNDSDAVIQAVKSSLRNLFLKYFDDCNVETAIEDTTSATRYDIRIYVVVTQEDQTVKLYNRLKISGTKLEESMAVRE